MSLGQSTGIPAYQHPSALQKDQIHLWRVDLDGLSVPPQQCLGVLSVDERERAERFRFELHRQRFVRCRYLLRTLLAGYIGTQAQCVTFVYSSYGKPNLGGEHQSSSIRFNVSHSDRMGLLGFTLGRQIGVDIEAIRQDIDVEQISARFFSEVERRALARLSQELKVPAFFRCWTRKEAFIKAKGEGLSLPLADFDVSIESTGARITGTRPDPEEARRWQLISPVENHDYAVALAFERTGEEPVLHQYQLGDGAGLAP